MWAVDCILGKALKEFCPLLIIVPMPATCSMESCLMLGALERGFISTPSCKSRRVRGFISFLSTLAELKGHIFILHIFCVNVKFNFCCVSVCFLDKLPILDNEIFQSVKPGLSAYADMPEKVSKALMW